MVRAHDNADIRVHYSRGSNIPDNNFNKTITDTKVIIYEDGFVYVEETNREYSPQTVAWIDPDS
jgi:hypothetical protein